MLKPLWGKRLPLKIRKDATHKEILEGGLSKWKIFNKAMIEDDENYMLYDDGAKPSLCQVKHKISLFCPSIGRNLGETTAELSISCVRKRITRDYMYHALGKDPNYSSDTSAEEDEGS